MSEPENFIARWSRRKAEAPEDAESKTVPADGTVLPDDIAGDDKERDDKASGAPAAVNESQSSTAATPPAVDLSALPPIDSIVAGTDIRAFLQAGVPADLTRAALRRAWSSDPTIRDFIGLAENSWDFTAPGGVPGFGPLSAEDASRLLVEFSSSVKDVTGKAKQAIDRIDALEGPAKPAQLEATPQESTLSPVRKTAEGAEPEISADEAQQQKPKAIVDPQYSLQRSEENIATQKTTSETIADARPTKRGHGGALPK